jgi:O-antigen ligase
VRKIALGLALLFIFVAPLKGSIMIGGAVTLGRLVGIIAGGFWAALVLIEGRFRRPGAYCIVVTLFVAWNTASYFWTIAPTESIDAIKTYGQVLVMVLMLWDLFRTKRAVEIGMQVYVLGGLVAIGALFMSFAAGASVSRAYSRYSVGGLDPNTMGVIIALGVPAAWYLLLEARELRRTSRLRWFNMAYVPAALLAIALTASRTASVTAVVVYAFGLWLLTRRGVSNRVLVAACVAIITLTAVPFVVPENSLARIATTREEALEGTMHGRVTIWKSGLETVAERPLVGHGTASFESAQRIGGKAAHNVFISVLVELGIIGLLLYVATWLLVALGALRLSKVDAVMWLTILLALGLGAVTHSVEQEQHVWLFLTLPVLSASASASQAERRLGRVRNLTRPHPA